MKENKKNEKSVPFRGVPTEKVENGRGRKGKKELKVREEEKGKIPRENKFPNPASIIEIIILTKSKTADEVSSISFDLLVPHPVRFLFPLPPLTPADPTVSLAIAVV